VERLLYRAGRIYPEREQPWTVYALSLVAFSAVPHYENETNYLRVYLRQIRRKLEPDPAKPR